MITFAEKITEMETIAREQTVIRFRKDILNRARYKAKQQNMSLNAFLEKTVEEAVRPGIPHLPSNFQIDPVIASFGGMLRQPTKEELEADPKLARIWRKCYETD
ncbi:MAG: hypothetical protein IJP81_06985 [Bacteroidales bacterium]|nr:hypothetical protein [Bacteroidales bacterium]